MIGGLSGDTHRCPLDAALAGAAEGEAGSKSVTVPRIPESLLGVHVLGESDRLGGLMQARIASRHGRIVVVVLLGGVIALLACVVWPAYSAFSFVSSFSTPIASGMYEDAAAGIKRNGYWVRVALKRGLADEDPLVRAMSALVFCRVSPKEELPLCVTMLGDRNADVRVYASLGLCRRGQDAVPHLIAALRSKDETARREAARTLGMIGRQANDAARGLAALLHDDCPGVRAKAAFALAFVGPTSEVLPDLIEALDDPSAHVRASALGAINQLEEGLVRQVPLARVLDALKSHELRLRVNAIFVLGRFPAGKAVPALLGALKDRHEKGRSAAAKALCTFGQIEPRVVPELAKLLDDESALVRACIASVLKRVGGGGTVEQLRRALSEESNDMVVGSLREAIEHLESSTNDSR